jgi:FG-GAP-like repeat
VRDYILSLTLLVGYAHADPGCPPVSFTSARSATLQPTPSTHRVLLKESDGSYTAFELSNTSPYSIARKVPHFEKQLSACAPTANGLPSLGSITLAHIPSGGYIFAIQQNIAVFDAQLNLVSEAPANLFPFLFADVNGDGKLDSIAITYQIEMHPLLAVALGDGGANFQAPTLYPIPGGIGVLAIAVADINGDGKPDIVVSTGVSHPMQGGVVTNGPGVLLQSATTRGTFGALQDLP